MTSISSAQTRSGRKRLIVSISQAAYLFVTFLAIYYCAFWVRFEGDLNESRQVTISFTLFWVAVAKLLVFWWFRTHHGPVRFVSFHDLITICKAAAVSLVVLALGRVFLFNDTPIPRSVLLIDCGLTVLVLGGVLATIRFANEFELLDFRSGRKTSVLILGDNNAADLLLRTIRLRPSLNYRAVGLISIDPVNHPTRVHGVPVVGVISETCQVANKLGVGEVLMTADQLSGHEVRKLVNEGRKCKLDIKVLPSMEQLLRGSVAIRPRTVSIEDLLRRKPVQLNNKELHDWLDDKVVLVTGSAGSIGSEICRQLLKFSPRKLLLIDQSENGQFFLERELAAFNSACQIEVAVADVSDQLSISGLFQKCRPDVVFHAAAYKHVPLMEQNVSEAVKNISLATQQLADLAHQAGVESFVLISTDKAVRPSSVMGACKHIAELYIQARAQSSDTRFVTVRFGNVLDSDGSVARIFRQQIESGGPVTVTHPDMERFFMTIPEASQLVIQAGAIGRGGDILALDMGDPVRIVDLAEDMIRLSGLEVGHDIDIEFTGIRPGEKLREELQGPQELRTSETTHPKIVALESTPRDFQSVRAEVDALARILSIDSDLIRHKLREVVPDYCANESKIGSTQRAA